jgi:hypothetical protein
MTVAQLGRRERNRGLYGLDYAFQILRKNGKPKMINGILIGKKATADRKTMYSMSNFRVPIGREVTEEVPAIMTLGGTARILMRKGTAQPIYYCPAL